MYLVVSLFWVRRNIAKAEIVQPFKIFDSNYSFASAKDDEERFGEMLPDSGIAEEYCQGKKSEVCYTIRNYINDILKKDFMGNPFIFKFDKTTFTFNFDEHDIFVTLSAVVFLSVSHSNTQWWKEPRQQIHNQGQTIETLGQAVKYAPESLQWRCSGVFIFKFENIFELILVFSMLTLSR